MNERTRKMHFIRSGLILCCRDYAKCRDFYRDVLELPIMFSIEEEPLCCFSLGTSYLMVEQDKKAKPSLNKLRLHIEDIRAIADVLKKKNIPFDERHASWGSVLEVKDPEGNRISIRDERTFKAQITN